MAPLLHTLLSLAIRAAPNEEPPVEEPTTTNSNSGTNAGIFASQQNSHNNTSTHHLSKRTIIIIIAACVGVLIISLPILVCCCLRSRRRKRKNYSNANASSQGHEMQTEWKLSDHVHSNASKPTKPVGKPSTSGGVGYQHDPEAEQGLLSYAGAPGHSSTGPNGHGHDYSGSTTSIHYNSRPSTDSAGPGGHSNSYSSAPPIHITAPSPLRPSMPEYEGSFYGNPPAGSQQPAQPHSPLEQPAYSSPPPIIQPPPLRPHVGATNQGGPVPLYLQHTSGGEADDYYSARSVTAREVTGQHGQEGSRMTE